MTSTTIREQVLAAFFTALSALATTASGYAYRNKTEPVEKFPAFIQKDGGHDSNTIQPHTGEDRYTLRLKVHCFVQKGDDANMTAAMDASYGAVAAMIAGFTTSDPILQLAEQVRETGVIDPEELDSDADIVINVEIEFTTRHLDPYHQ